MKKIALVALMAFCTGSFGANARECRQICELTEAPRIEKCIQEKNCYAKESIREQVDCEVSCKVEVKISGYSNCFSMCLRGK